MRKITYYNHQDGLPEVVMSCPINGELSLSVISSVADIFGFEWTHYSIGGEGFYNKKMNTDGRFHFDPLGYPIGSSETPVQNEIISMFPNKPIAFLPGFDKAIIGLDFLSMKVVYSEQRVISQFVDDGMNYEEAVDWINQHRGPHLIITEVVV